MKELIKKRSFVVPEVACEKSQDSLRSSLMKLEGVRKVDIRGKGKIRIEYNLLQVSLKAVCESVQRSGYTLSTGLWQQFKLGWLFFTEENEFENMTHQHECCSVVGAENIADRRR